MACMKLGDEQVKKNDNKQTNKKTGENSVELVRQILPIWSEPS